MIFAADPEDTTGFKKAYELKSSLKKLQAEIVQIARKGDLAKAEKTADDFIIKHQLTGENKQKALLTKLNCYDPRKPGILEKAAQLMEQIIAIDPASPTGAFAKNIQGQIAQMKAQQKTPQTK